MVTENTNKEPLLPDRHPQQELFLCDISDAVIKDDMASMEHPIFSLSKKPDTKIRRYEHGDKWLEVVPSVKGVATIYDKDILIYAISKLMAAKKAGQEITRDIRMSARDLLIFTNRSTSGYQYNSLKDALERLDGTRIRTNIKTGNESQLDGFGLIERIRIRKDDETGRVIEWGLTLSEWLFNAIHHNEVLTLHPDYFRLRKPLERRVYEIARKHCGAQPNWKISLLLLKKKCGSNSPTKHFRYLVKDLVSNDHLPDYSVSLEDDMVKFTNRRVVEEVERITGAIHLDPTTYNDARTCAPGYDVYYLEQRWRSWMADGGMDAPRDPDQAFLGFCRRYYERNGAPK